MRSLRHVRPTAPLAASLIACALSASSAHALSSRLLITPTGLSANDNLGGSVASAGDFNGDGYADLIVGASLADANGVDAGAAYIYFGGPGSHTTPDLYLIGPGAGARFGISVAGIGDFNHDGYDDVIVGAHLAGGTGRAYIYYGGRLPDAIADLTLQGAAGGDLFGAAVAGAGDVNGDGAPDVIVGAPQAGGDGRAYVFFGGTNPDAAADITLLGLQLAGDAFGAAVAGAGDVNGDGFADVIVGAPLANINATDSGTVLIYLGGAGLGSATPLLYPGNAQNDEFGYSVAGCGDLNGDGFADVVVGAYGAGGGRGAATVLFGGPVPGATSVVLLGSALYANFGVSVAGAGDVNRDGYADLLIGEQNGWGEEPSAGRAYLYLGGASFDSTPDAVLLGSRNNDHLGVSVSRAGDVDGDGFGEIVVGALFNSASAANAGRAYVWSFYPYQVLSPNGGETWIAGRNATVRWRGSDVADLSLSTDGGANWTTLASGIGGLADNTFALTVPSLPTGSAKVRLSASGQPVKYSNSDASDRTFRILAALETPPAAAERLQRSYAGSTSGETMGGRVGHVGDVNGDGFADILVSSFFSGPNGRAFLHYGGPSGDAVADLTLNGEAPLDGFGDLSVTPGDLNGDGYADIVVGAHFNNAGGALAGRAYVYFGGPSLDAVPDLILTGAAPGDRFGAAVAMVGDVNGDGYGDLLIGAYLNDAGSGNPNADVGRAYLYFGGPQMDNVPDLVLTGAGPAEWFGVSVGAAGDVNGDGYADIIVGAYDSSAGGTFSGRAYLFLGGPIPDSTPDLVLTGATATDYLGRVVGSAGDVNGDGYGDFFVSVPGSSAGGNKAGQVQVFFGGPTPHATPDWVITGTTPNDQFGLAVAPAGDVNGDGYSDLLVATQQNAVGGSAAGRAYLFLGGPDPDAIADAVWTGGAGDFLGQSVAGAGDVNGDGFDDVLIPSSGFDGGFTDAGRVALYDFNRYFVTSPNGGETWNVGALKTVSWLGAALADVWLSIDGGSSYQLLRSNVGGEASNSFSLRVPHTPTRFARIKVTANARSITGLDESDSLFTIQTSITLLQLAVQPAPEGGAMLSWSTDPPVGPDGISGYRVYRLRSSDDLAGERLGPDLITETYYRDASGTPGNTYRLTSVNGLGEEVELGHAGMPAAFAGLRAWPLPMRGGEALSVSFAAPMSRGLQATDLEVGVYDVRGRRVANLARGGVAAQAGLITLSWGGRSGEEMVAPGIYFLRASAASAGFCAERKLVVVR